MHPVLRTAAAAAGLVILAVVAGSVAAAAFAIVAHAILVATIGQEAIPAFDNTLGMRVLVLADYVFGVVSGVAASVAAWRWILRRR